MDSFLNNINSILDTDAPLKKSINIKFKTKPWITPALQKSVSVKRNLLKIHNSKRSPSKRKVS